MWFTTSVTGCDEIIEGAQMNLVEWPMSDPVADPWLVAINLCILPSMKSARPTLPHSCSLSRITMPWKTHLIDSQIWGILPFKLPPGSVRGNGIEEIAKRTHFQNTQQEECYCAVIGIPKNLNCIMHFPLLLKNLSLHNPSNSSNDYVPFRKYSPTSNTSSYNYTMFQQTHLSDDYAKTKNTAERAHYFTIIGNLGN